MSKRLIWMAITAASATLGTAVARTAIKAGWRATMKTDPPNNPAAVGTSWGQAITWAVITGAVLGITRVAIRRGLSARWEKTEGTKPPERR